MTDFIRKHYRGNLIASGGYDITRASAGIHANHFDLVSIGKPFIANPDFVQIVKTNGKLRPYDPRLLEELI